MSDEVLGGGKYKIVRRLAQGGMGEVLLADFAGDAEIGPGLLVVKRILSAAPGLAPAESQVRMLLEEGRLGTRLSHENLVETFRMEKDGQTPLLVIELLAGRSMAQVLGQAKKRKEMVPPDIALAILRGSCCGLHFAHTLKGPDGASLGLVHRDVSPANIFVTFDGKVKVIDFGVAKSEDSEVKTATGILKGKLGYMSPEQSLGSETLPAQADVWSLGVFFWEMLIAERLFSSPNPTATLLQISQKDIPRPRTLRPDLPPEVEAIAMKMLQRPREDRYASCADVVRAIDDVPWFTDDIDVGGWLAGRFPEEAQAGVADAKRGARRRSKVSVATGLHDGTTGTDPEQEDEFATMILPSGLREALLSSSKEAPSTTVDDDDLATVRVSADIVAQLRQSSRPSSKPFVPSLADDDEENIVTSRVDPVLAASFRTAQPQPPSPPSVTDSQTLSSQTLPRPSARATESQTAPQPRAQTSSSMMTEESLPPTAVSTSMPTTPQSSIVSTTMPLNAPRTSSPSGAVPLRSTTSQGVAAIEEPSFPAASPTSWVTIALGTFGAVLMAMGVVFSFVVQEPRQQLFVYQDPAGYDVIIGDAQHAPPGRTPQPLDVNNATLLRGGSLEPALVDPAVLKYELMRHGVWQRASLPTTSKTKTAALLPLIVVCVGLLALAFAVPAVLVKGSARVVVQALAIVAGLVVVGVLVSGGGLSWPGLAAYAKQPKYEWR